MTEKAPNLNPSEEMRQEFDKISDRPWLKVETLLLRKEGQPFLLRYKEVDIKNSAGIVERYVLGISDKSAWGESTSPKCLNYGKNCPVTAIGNLVFYFRKPEWAWEKKKIVELTFEMSRIMEHLSYVFDQVRRADKKAEDDIRNRVDPRPEDVEEDMYVYIILHSLLKLLSNSSFGERMENYKDFLRSTEEYWRKRIAYYKWRMIFAQRMFKRFETKRTIFED